MKEGMLKYFYIQRKHYFYLRCIYPKLSWIFLTITLIQSFLHMTYTFQEMKFIHTREIHSKHWHLKNTLKIEITTEILLFPEENITKILRKELQFKRQLTFILTLLWVDQLLGSLFKHWKIKITNANSHILMRMFMSSY